MANIFSPLEQFVIWQLFPIKIPTFLFAAGEKTTPILNFSITNSTLWLLLAIGLNLWILEDTYEHKTLPKSKLLALGLKDNYRKWILVLRKLPRRKAFDKSSHDLLFFTEGLLLHIYDREKTRPDVRSTVYSVNFYRRLYSRWIFHAIFIFVRDLLKEQVGEKGKPYLPIIFTIFIFILSLNLIGMIPFGFTVTSHFVVTFGLSVPVFIGVTIIGFQQHGIHFLSFLLPPGAPLMLAPLLVVLELVSYSFRAISLGVRLFANMMAGHTLVTIIAGFGWSMGCSESMALNIAASIPSLVIFALTILELGVAVLQAYVFTILSCIYLNDAIALH
jgi:F-type H+-transporting ATPase subunit a